MFCYRARKYLGAYLAVLDGAAQAVIFSGGIGENSPLVRKNILDGMEWCGLILDDAGNEQRDRPRWKNLRGTIETRCFRHSYG